jgi:Gene product 88
MSTRPAVSTPTQHPFRLLTQNREMRKIGVWNFSLPAWAGRLPDGRTYNTCRSAGVCRQVCYARRGTYTWPAVLAKHQANLQFYLDDPTRFEAALLAELAAPKFTGAWIRIHDSGDFWSLPYLQMWLRVCRIRPDVNYYTYTKEIALFREHVEPDPPDNFLWSTALGALRIAI